jgi:phage-related protein
MLALLEQVAEAGPPSDTERSHKITGAIWELIHGDLRILYFFDAGRLVVCTTGFVKKSKKTPTVEIARAAAAFDRYQDAKKVGRIEVEEDAE